MSAEQDAPDVAVTDSDEPTSTATEAEAIETAKATPKPKRDLVGRVRQGARKQWATIALALALVAAAGLAAWTFFFVYQPDRETDTAAADSAIKAASDGTVALLSYSPDSLDKDFATAKSKLTGSFLSYYTQFTEQIVAPAAKQKAVKTEAAVVRAAVSEIHPDTAVVLVFINQTTESKDRPDASFINSAVRVTMQKVDGGWLISSFDPV
ncbi:twin-arginine translocation pathway signal [Mycolicibacterium stellerae]|uniref:twin-arginine translocation pathway signal n=1 Tax=Mycolicibacterium stellerae TaxID=2358193 RepID=UPI001F3D2AD3|nr:twin-arginine translocation pathway signal [Mycolicibacterium stellerae]